MASFTFTAAANGTFAGTAADDLFIWPAAGGSIDAGDTFFGATGTDTLRLDGATALSFSGAAASQWMEGIERVVANNTGNNSITIGALAGAPDAGAITMVGAVGNDVFDISARAAGYDGSFDAGGGHDSFAGGGGDDLFRPGTGNDSFAGGAGDDTVEFAQNSLLGTQPFDGTDLLAGGHGIDTLRVTGDAAPGAVLTIELKAPLISGFEVIDLGGHAGPSLIHMSDNYVASGDVTVLGGAGGDTVDDGFFTSTRFVTFFAGGAGNDAYLRSSGAGGLFRPGAGADTLSGSIGSDVVEMALADLDTLDSFRSDPAGTDVIRFTAGGVLTAPLAARFVGFERLELDAGGIAITLRALPVFHALDQPGGAPLPVQGGSGNDLMDLRHLAYAATVLGSAGNDTAYGGLENDSLAGGAQADLLHGLSGNDLLSGEAGNDRLVGGAGNDRLAGGFGADMLSGGAGNDTIEQVLNGDGTSDAAADTMLGGAGSDIIVLDDIAFLDAADWFAGGLGQDSLSLVARAAREVPLDVSGRLSGFESVFLDMLAMTGVLTFRIGDSMAESAQMRLAISSYGNAGTARVMLDAGAVTSAGVALDGSGVIGGGAVADTLIGGGGADLFGNILGADSVAGGGGDDTVSLSLDDLNPSARFDGAAGIDTVRISGAAAVAGDIFGRFASFEIIQLDDAFNTVSFGNAGIPAGGSFFAIAGGGDIDLLDASAATTGLTLFGFAGDDELAGGAGGDVLNGGTGSDWLTGGAGNDTIRVEDFGGDDIAEGGAGIDLLALDLAGTRAPAAFFLPFSGFEALSLGLDNAIAALPAALAAAAGSGGFAIDLVTSATSQRSALNAGAVTTRLVIQGGLAGEAITGGRNSDTIRDGAGADRIQGFLGADRIELAADGAADRILFGNASDGSRDIFAAAGAGTLAQADTITGFTALGDIDNALEFARAGFAGIGTKAAVTTLAANAAIDLSAAAVFILDAANAVAGFADRAAITSAFASRVQAGDLGQGAIVVARGGSDAALYYLRDLDGLAGMADADVVLLLAVLVAPGAITASEILLA